MNIKHTLMSKFGRQILLARKHAPKGLFVAGVAGMVTTVVLASRATLKLQDVIEDLEKQNNQIDTALQMADANYSQEDAQRDSTIVLVKTSITIAKLYAPAVVVGVASIAALTGSHAILTNRLNGVTAAYAMLDKGFRRYRSRVITELGAEKDHEFLHGVEEIEVVENTPEGPVTKKVMGPAKHGESPYAVWFDERSSQWKRELILNQMCLRSTQDWANDMLRAYGFLFLNDVYKMLGLPVTPEGQQVGWILNNPNGGDNYVDFGIFNHDFFTVERFVRGDTGAIILDFNVDGVIWDLIGDKKR